ncbi:MAG: 2-succinyl-5-enolpyruvyl-6-hydroxy-3-cyclohexene-1-carboxylic-acid synthase [Salinirussus sp.]
MTAPNRATLWGQILVEECAAAGLSAACVAPGSRSTPLTIALAQHDDVDVYSHLDERSAAFFALGRGRRTGEPTAVVTTSGTAAANLHPAVIEADRGRVPLLLLTADRPQELQDSGANQTIDQADLYGDAVRWHRTLPEPAPEARRLRSLRVAADRAVATTTGVHPGPVHLNIPFAKPLEPTPVEGDVPTTLDEQAGRALDGREGPYVSTSSGRPTLDDGTVATVAERVDAAERGLIVCGPADAGAPDREGLSALLGATEFPLLADPLSGHRFGPLVDEHTVCGGYDAYIDAIAEWPAPDVVLRFGASPTSKALRHYLRDVDPTTFLVDPAGEWREAEFAATDHLVADPGWFATTLAEQVSDGGDPDYATRFSDAETQHWAVVNDALGGEPFEGGLLCDVADLAPDPSTLVVSNSMPVRDLDRFGKPRAGDITVLGNRGASGIDGITSTALGAASATDDPLIAVIGDLAYYHDMNGLLAIGRCDVDATIVLVDNDGGGIFHMLPIAEFDPPFTELFATPHGLDFSPTADLYGLEFVSVDDRVGARAAIRESLDADGTQVIHVGFDAAASHQRRAALAERVAERL